MRRGSGVGGPLRPGAAKARHNFDAESRRDQELIDKIVEFDEGLIDAGRIKPCRMIAAMRSVPVENPVVFKHRTPAFCLRVPD